MLTARRRYRLAHSPPPAALVHLAPATHRAMLDVVADGHWPATPIVPADFAYPGLNAEAWPRYWSNRASAAGRCWPSRGLIQATTKCIRVFPAGRWTRLPWRPTNLDLAGAYPCTEADSTAPERFFDDLALRLVTAVSTAEVTHHHLDPEADLGGAVAALATPPPCTAPARSWAAVPFSPRCCASPIWYRSRR